MTNKDEDQNSLDEFMEALDEFMAALSDLGATARDVLRELVAEQRIIPLKDASATTAARRPDLVAKICALTSCTYGELLAEIERGFRIYLDGPDLTPKEILDPSSLATILKFIHEHPRKAGETGSR